MSLSTTQTFSRTNMREFAFTIDAIQQRVHDHVFSHSPALAIFANQTLGDFGGTKMAGSGHETQTGGHAVVTRVTLGEHAGAGRASGPFGTHNVAPDDNARLTDSNWKFYNHGLTVSTHDLRINRGDLAISSFLENQTTQVMRALANLVADDIYSTTSPATAINSLDDLIAAGTTAVMGLDPDDYNRWASRGLSAVDTAPASVSFASGSFVAQGLSDMRTLENNASEGMIQPMAFLTDYATHERYEGVLQPQERFAGAVPTADGGFVALAFKGRPVMPDRKANAGFMYAIRTGEDGIRFIALAGADFDFGEWKPSSNQNAMVRPLELTCQMIIGNRQYGCNKMTGITD